MKEPWESQELTPEQERMWGDTMSLMRAQCPGFQHLLYKLLATNNKAGVAKNVAVFTDKVPIAATDGHNILINPETFFKLKLPERAFAVAHEVVHNMFGDVELYARLQSLNRVPMPDGTSMPLNKQTVQKAFDFRINPLLVKSRIGKPIQGICLDDAIGKANDSFYTIYKKIYDDEENGQGKGQPIDVILAPGTSCGGTTTPQRNQQQWQVQVGVAEQLEKTMGKAPADLMRAFGEILEPEVPWTEHIKGTVNRVLGSDRYNWTKPNRRFLDEGFYLPTRSGYGAGWVILLMDVSGSISEGEMRKYLGECASILTDVRPRRLTIIWIDAKVQRVDELADVEELHNIRKKGIPGGGGTCFKDAFKWIYANLDEQPDMFVGFTDGYADPFPDEPKFPVMWACTTDHKFPYGDVVRIKPPKHV